MARRVTRVDLQADISAYVRSTRDAGAATDTLRTKAERFSKGKYTATAGVDTKAARTELSSLEKELARLNQSTTRPAIGLVDTEAQARLDAIQARLTELGARTTDARLDVADAEAQTKLSRIEAQLLAIGAQQVDPSLDLRGIADAEAKLGVLEAQLVAFDHQDFVAEVHVDGTARASRSASFLVDTVVSLGPAAVAAGGVASGALIGLAGAFTTAAGPAGLLALAVAGQVKAMKEQTQQIKTDTAHLGTLTKGTDAYRAQLAKVRAETQAFNQQFGVAADAVDHMKTVWNGFLAATGQGGVNQLIADAVNLAGKFLPAIQGIVSASAGAVSQMIADLQAFGRSPDAQELIAFLETRGPAAIVAFGAVAGNIGKGLLSLFMAFAPLETSMLGGLQDITAEFAKWAAHVGQTQGFEAFMEYIRVNGPKVWDTLGALAEALLAIATAAAPVGAITLPIIKALAEALTLIAQSPVGPVLVGAAVAMTTLNRALTVTKAIGASEVGKTISGMGGNISKAGAQALAAKAGFVAAGIGLEVLASHLGPAHEELKGLLTVAGGAAMGAAFGPLGAAIGGAAGALQLLSSRSQQASADQAALDQSSQAVADTLDQQTGAITRNTLAMLQKHLADTGAYDRAQELGISFDLVTRAAMGQQGAIAELHKEEATALGRTVALQKGTEDLGKAYSNNGIEVDAGTASIDTNAAAVDHAKGIISSLNGILGTQSDKFDESRRHIEQQRRAIDLANLAQHPWRTSAAQTASVMDRLGISVDGVAASAGRNTAQSPVLVSAWQKQVDILADATTNADEYKVALDRLVNTNGNVYDSQRAITTGYLNLKAAVKASGTSLDDQTSAGNANIDMLKGQVENIKTFLEAEKSAGKGPKQLAADLRTQRLELVKNFGAMRFSKSRVEALLQTYGLTPKLISTLFDAVTGPADKKIADTQKHADALGKTKPNVYVYTDTGNANAALQDTQDRADFLDHTRPVVVVDSDTADAVAKMRAFATTTNAILAGIPNQTVDVLLSEQANNKLAQLGSAIFNADGNVYEPHHATIARGGAMRIWNEPETGGEAYIPLSPAKRPRSRAILAETARHLGGEAHFAEGGVYGVDGPALNVHAAATGMAAAISAVERTFSSVATRLGDRIAQGIERRLAQMEARLARMPGGRGAPVGGGLYRPVNGPVTQGLHDTWTGYPAIDIGVPVGTPVHAGASGRVTTSADIYGNQVGGYASYGRYMVIDSGNFRTLYAHLSQRGLAAGQAATGGATIGLSGDTGNTFGAHLHFGAAGISPYAFGYDDGGKLPPGGWGHNTLAKPESVLTPHESEQFDRLISSLSLPHAAQTVVVQPPMGPLKIEGTVTIDEKGQMFLRGIARNEVDQAASHASTMAGLS